MARRMNRIGRLIAGVFAVAAVGLGSGCAGADPYASQAQPTVPDGTIVVGSAGFVESEILAEVYAAALRSAGVNVSTKLNIGQRDVYIAALQDGSIDVIPEFSGNLLQYFAPERVSGGAQEVLAALEEALPDDLAVLSAAQAQDADSYVVTAEFSQSFGVTSLADLAGLTEPFTVAGNPELAERPYGPGGLTKVYGVPAELVRFAPFNDSGGPLTIAALREGKVQLADVYSTSPAIAEEQLVVLADPKGMILPQQVLPLMRDARVAESARVALDRVSAQLTTADLIAMNAQSSGDEKLSAKKIAAKWASAHGF